MPITVKEQIAMPGEILFGIGVDYSPLFGHYDASELCDDAIRILTEWCTEHCSGKWQFQRGLTVIHNGKTRPGCTVLQFENSKDAIYFKMKWL